MTNRSGYCIVSISPVREEKRDASEMVSQLMFGEIVSIEEISAPWCKIRTYTDNYCGYVDIKHIHFLSEKEVNRWLDGLSYEKHFIRTLNTPWGKQHIYRGSFVPYGASTNFNIGNDHFEFDEDNFDLAFKSPVELVTEYLNTPYLWGGKSPFGIGHLKILKQVTWLSSETMTEKSFMSEFSTTKDRSFTLPGGFVKTS